MTIPWFTSWSENRNDYSDVILWSRLWVYRNFRGQSLGPPWSFDLEETLGNRASLLIKDKTTLKGPFFLDDAHRSLISMMIEANLLGTGDYGQDWKKFFLSSQGSEGVFLMRHSHFQFFFWEGGFPGKSWIQEKLVQIRGYEESEPFSFHPRWGYLNSSLKTLGSGTELEFLLHLPALVYAGALMKVLEYLEESGFEVRGFYAQDSEDWGDFFLIRLPSGLGGSFPLELTDKLEQVLHQIVTFERKVRLSLQEEQKLSLDDLFGRSQGLLKGARILRYSETLEALSKLRWASLTTANHELHVEQLEKLLYLINVGILKIVRSQNQKEDMDLDEMRSILVRQILFQEKEEGFHV